MKKLPLKIASAWILMIQLFLPVSTYGQIDWQEYPVPLADSLKSRVRFGYLTVPETRLDTNNRTLQIGFCLLKSTSKTPLKDAVIYLPGGPGQGNTNVAPFFLAGESINRILKQRDILLFDPRGCGTSEPQLCVGLKDPEIFNANLSGLTQSQYMDLIGSVMRKCRDSLAWQGVNLESYGSSDIARDLEDLRIALGYDRWNIRGHSYGSRYAQSYIRHFPDRVRSAVLSGLVPAAPYYEDSPFYGFVNALRLVFDQCAANMECNQAFPELEKDFIQLLTRIEDKPIVLPPGSSDLLPRSSMVLNPPALLSGLFQAMYSREGIEIIPLIIHALSKGKDWITRPLALSIGADFGLQNDMYHIIRCNDNPGIRFAPEPIVSDPMGAQLYAYWTGDQTQVETELCQNLSITLDSMEQYPIQSNIPMLLFTGEFDPVTPTYNTEAVSHYLPNAVSFMVPGYSHDGAAPIPDIIADFFIDPDTKPDLGLIGSIEPVHFLSGVTLNEGISGLAVVVARGDFLSPAFIGGTILLLLLSGFIYFPLYGLFLRSRHQSKALVIKHYLPVWTISLAGILFMALLYFAFKNAMDINPYLLAFGLPENWDFIFHILWFIILMLIISALFSKPIWGKRTGIIPRVFWILSWFGGFGLLLLLWFLKLV